MLLYQNYNNYVSQEAWHVRCLEVEECTSSVQDVTCRSLLNVTTVTVQNYSYSKENYELSQNYYRCWSYYFRGKLPQCQCSLQIWVKTNIQRVPCMLVTLQLREIDIVITTLLLLYTRNNKRFHKQNGKISDKFWTFDFQPFLLRGSTSLIHFCLIEFKREGGVY